MICTDMNRHKQFLVNRNSPVPLYIQLKDIIKEQIAEGILIPDKPLPSERELCTIYDISHITVRQALVELTKEGTLFRVPGRGTYVKDGKYFSNNVSALPLGVIIPETEGTLASSFISNFLLGIKSVSTKQNYPLMLYTESEARYLTDIETGKIQGLILTDPMSKDTRIMMLKNKNLPFVIIGNTNIEGVKSVNNDNVEIGSILATHLINSGDRRIGFINGPLHFTVSEDRLEGYKKALSENKISFEESIVKYGQFSEENGYSNAKQLMQEGIDAIIGADDFIAVGALRAIKEAGLKIPEEIRLAGCNNSPFTAHLNPTLTTVEIFPYAIGQKAAEKIIRIITGGKTEEKTIIKIKLIVRGTTNREGTVKSEKENLADLLSEGVIKKQERD